MNVFSLTTRPRKRWQPMRPRRRQQQRPRGAALMFVLIATVVVTMLGAALIQAMALEMRQSHIDQWAAQADWLVTAAANRAAARLRADSEYQGETWHIDAALLDDPHAAEITIAVTQPEVTTARQVAITARYPTDTPVFVSRQKTIEVSLGNITVNNTETPAAEDAP